MSKRIFAATAMFVWTACWFAATTHPIAAQETEAARPPVVNEIVVHDVREKQAKEFRISPYWIGVALSELTDTLKSQLQLNQGVVITEVMDDGPAARVGLQAHDIVLEFNGAKIDSVFDLMTAVGKAEEKESRVAIVRQGKRQTMKVTPVKRPAEAAQPDSPETENLKSYLEKAVRAGAGGQRFMIVRPPALAAKVQFPKHLELHAVLSRDGQHKYEINLNGKKYSVEGNDFSKLPAEVRKALPFLSGIGIAPRILIADGDASQLKLKFNEDNLKGVRDAPLRRVEVEVESTATEPKRVKRRHVNDDVSAQVRELAEQIRKLSKEVQSLKEAQK